MSAEEGAEQSKDYILDQLYKSTADLGVITSESIGNTLVVVATTIFVVLMLVVILVVVFLVYGGLISGRRGILAVVILAVLLLVMLFVLVTYVRDYARKSIGGAINIFNSFIASENVLVIIDGAATVYNNNT